MIGTVVALAASAGCGGGGGKAAKQNEAPQTVPRDITGFGATSAAWNRTHTKDPDYPHFYGDVKDVYDADPSLHLWPKAVKAHYLGVLLSDNRVRGYEYLFNPRPLEAAKADVLRTQFPPDAKVTWFKVKTKLFPEGSGSPCAQMIVTSKTLAKVLDTKEMRDKQGSALVYFYSYTKAAPDRGWDPNAVVSARLALGNENGPGLRRAKEGYC